MLQNQDQSDNKLSEISKIKNSFSSEIIIEDEVESTSSRTITIQVFGYEVYSIKINMIDSHYDHVSENLF